MPPFRPSGEYAPQNNITEALKPEVERTPGTVAEMVEYQTTLDDEKMRRYRGWQAMMREGDSTFGEMFGYTRYQKALVELARSYGLDEQADSDIIDGVVISSNYFRTRIGTERPDLSDEEKDVEAFLHGKAVLLHRLPPADGIYRSDGSKRRGNRYHPLDTVLPSEKILPQFRKLEVSGARELVAGRRDDVYVNIGDPFEWTNVHRDRRDVEGNPTTYLVEYSPGDASSFIGMRAPKDMVGIHQLERTTDPDNTHSTTAGVKGSVVSAMQELMEFRADGLGSWNQPDSEWLDALGKVLPKACALHQELANQTHTGDYLGQHGTEVGGRFAQLQELKQLWEEVLRINQNRYDGWRAMGKDPSHFAYDTSEGLSPIDELAQSLEINGDNIRSAAAGFEATIEHTPGLLHEWFEELADAHIAFEQGRLPKGVHEYYTEEYKRVWLKTVQQHIPGFSEDQPDMVAAYNAKQGAILYDLFKSNGFQIVRGINPDLFHSINSQLTERILKERPHVPKTENAALLEEVFPNTSLPSKRIDRVTACWSLSRQAMAMMSSEERTKIWAELDRILRPGGRATIYPIDYWEDPEHPRLDEGSLIEMINQYKAATGSKIEPEFRYAGGDYREHLVLILKQPH